MRSYPKYKLSGVDYLGEIPCDWSVWKIFRLFKKIGSGTTPKAGTPEYYENGIIPWINTGDLNDGYISDCPSYITQKAFDEHTALKIYDEGTLLVAMYGATIGKTAITKLKACTNQACCSLVASKLIDIKFAFYWFIANKENIINLSYGGGQPNISQDIVRALKISVCSIDEQQQIVTFLDYKTEQCDRFIANRQKQIELLNEQKASIINKAVTKGINPNVKMKPSGIEWLPEVPADWDVWKMIRLCKKIGDGLHGTPVYEEGSGIFFINGNNLSNGNIEINENTREVEPKHFEAIKKDILIGSILFSINGTIGSNAIYKGENILLSKSAAFFECKTKIINLYLLRYLTSNSVLNYLYSTTEGTTIKNISLDTLRNLKIPLPSNLEQQIILDFIKKETSTIETLISKYQKQIDLMQEYRTALISQAVTGKIDVREWKHKTK